MRIAVVGAGISGLLSAWLLRQEHEVVVLEAGGHAGGHTRTITVDDGGSPLAVDTGFIVYNDRNYPNFVALLGQLGVVTRASDMSFSVRDERDGLEYAGSDDPRLLFAQRRNLLRPRFWGMLRDLRRFYREAPLALGQLPASTTVGEWLDDRGYGRAFVEQHIVPMGGAIWSSGRQGLRAFPAEHFLRFLHNHGMLQLKDRPRWRTVVGGSHEYVRALLRGWEGEVRLHTPVHAIRRDGAGVELDLPGQSGVRFDRVVLATHADQSLRLLADADPEERALLSPFRFSRNDIALHRDRRLLPRRRRAWACWNAHLLPGDDARVAVTYHMNRLQGLDSAQDWMVSLNRDGEVDPALVHDQAVLEHPIFSAGSSAAQGRLAGRQGARHTWFAGAWTGWGFHEDGARSAVAVANDMGVRAPWQ